MNQETDMIVEIWDGIKPYIRKKDRLDLADHLVAVFDDYGMADGLPAICDTADQHLAAAIKGRYGIDEEEDDLDEYESQY